MLLILSLLPLLTIVTGDCIVNFSHTGSYRYAYWKTIKLVDSHRGRSANQPPDLWNRIILTISPPMENILITSCDPFGNVYNNAHVYNVFYYNTSHNRFDSKTLIYFDFEYWYHAFNIYIGTFYPIKLNYTIG